MGLSQPCLLLDLDCATIYGGNPRDGLRGDVVLLHPNLHESLSASSIDVVLLTHRSARQATILRAALEARGCHFRDCISARELFLAGLRSGQWRLMVSRGLSKSLALSYLHRRYGVSPSTLVLLDDRKENLREMELAGCERQALAPFDVNDNDGDVTYQTYDMADVLKWLQSEGAEGCFVPIFRTRSASECPVIAHIGEQERSLLEALRHRVNRWRKQLRRWRKAA